MRLPRIGTVIPSQRRNVQTLQSTPLSELSGSLGDLGTLLPLLIALTLTQSISLSTTLVFTGIANVATGVLFSIPLPVQPMKAIAAVAISRTFSQEETASAGLFVAAVVGVLSVTGLLRWIGRVVPVPVIKGIQVGAGLTLVLSAGANLLQPLRWIRPHAGDNLIWALAAAILLLIVGALPTRKGVPRLPYALIVFVVGLIIASIVIHILPPNETRSFSFSFWHPHALSIRARDFRTGALAAGLGQIPLTTLNSIIAVTHLSAELLPDTPAPTPTALGLSVAVMNAVSCPFGAMPTCHGSGGLAGQYSFGARSGSSVIVLGIFKLVLGLLLSEAWLVEVLRRFPRALLGVMVIAAGMELAKVGAGLNAGASDLWERAENGEERAREVDEKERGQRWTVMLVTVSGILAFRNDAVGFGAGLICHWSFWASQRWEAWWRARRGSNRSGHELEAEERQNEERAGLLEDSRH